MIEDLDRATSKHQELLWKFIPREISRQHQIFSTRQVTDDCGSSGYEIDKKIIGRIACALVAQPLIVTGPQERENLVESTLVRTLASSIDTWNQGAIYA